MPLLAVRAFADAESVLRERNALHALTDPDEWTAFNAKAMLGIALLGLGKGAEALPLLEARFVGMKARAVDIPAAVRRERLEDAQGTSNVGDAPNYV